MNKNVFLILSLFNKIINKNDDMKFRYLVPLIFLFSSLITKAQDFNGGLMAGIVGSQVAGDTYSGYNKAGIYAGAFVNLQFSPHSLVQMELEYFQKGSRKNPNPKKEDYDEYLFRANYIELPVLYQYVVNDWLKLEAGPSLGFFTTYYEEFNTQEITQNPPAKISYQINLGIYFGLTQKLLVNLRTNNSILNIRSKNTTGDIRRFFDYGQYHDSLVLSLVYQFKSAKK
jgi:hypothetical protein